MEDQIRTRMVGAKIVDVIGIYSPAGDELILTFPEGDAVSIKADRLRLTHEETFEADLAAIEIVDGRTNRPDFLDQVH